MHSGATVDLRSIYNIFFLADFRDSPAQFEFLDSLGLLSFENIEYYGEGAVPGLIETDLLEFLYKKGYKVDLSDGGAMNSACLAADQAVETLEFLKSIGAKIIISDAKKFVENSLPGGYGDSRSYNEEVIKVYNFFLKAGINVKEIYEELYDEDDYKGGRYESRELGREFFEDDYIINLFKKCCIELDAEAIINLLYTFSNILLPICDADLFAAIDQITDINNQTQDQKTLLHLAIHLQRPDIVKALIKNLTSPDIMDNEEHTVRELIEKMENAALKEALENEVAQLNLQYKYTFESALSNIHAQSHKIDSFYIKTLGIFNNNVRQALAKMKLLISSDNFATIKFLFGDIAKFFSADELKKLASFDIENVSKLTDGNNNGNDNIIVEDVAHDGNCFFHVISANTGLTHEEIRAGAINHIIEHIEEFKGFIVTDGTPEANIGYYIDTMATTTTWADHNIIQAAANAFNLHIRILRADNHELVTEVTPANAGETPAQVITAIYTGNHYMAGYPAGYRAPTQDEITQLQLVTSIEEVNALPVVDDLIYTAAHIVQANGTTSEYPAIALNAPALLGLEFTISNSGAIAE